VLGGLGNAKIYYESPGSGVSMGKLKFSVCHIDVDVYQLAKEIVE
jgi:hypothetical protein